MTEHHADRDLRAAALAHVLAASVRAGELHDVDALRVIRHELRRRNTNKKTAIARRSAAAQEVIVRYAAAGQPPPKNGSPEALHADHVHTLTTADLRQCQNRDDWLHRLSELREVVCVTAEENYRLQAVEKAGTTGWAKYEVAGIGWAAAPTPEAATLP